MMFVHFLFHTSNTCFSNLRRDTIIYPPQTGPLRNFPLIHTQQHWRLFPSSFMRISKQCYFAIKRLNGQRPSLLYIYNINIFAFPHTDHTIYGARALTQKNIIKCTKYKKDETRERTRDRSHVRHLTQKGQTNAMDMHGIPDATMRIQQQKTKPDKIFGVDLGLLAV